MKLSLRNVVIVIFCAVGGTSSAANAQRINTIKPSAPASVTIDGVVRDNEGRALSAAEVIVDDKHRSITNSRGEFSISGLDPGVIEFTTRRIGYTPITSAVQVDPGALAVHLAVKLVPLAIQLGKIVVEGKRLDKSLWQTGFYQRQQTGMGHYFDDMYLKRYQASIATLIGTVPSVFLDRASNGTAVALGRLANGSTCPLAVFVDGNFIPWARDLGLDNVVNRDDILAVEVYPRASEIPAKIAGKGGMSGVGSIGTVNIQGSTIQAGQVYAECGAVLIWTKPLESKR
jgi:hypothetical protein